MGHFALFFFSFQKLLVEFCLWKRDEWKNISQEHIDRRDIIENSHQEDRRLHIQLQIPPGGPGAGGGPQGGGIFNLFLLFKSSISFSLNVIYIYGLSQFPTFISIVLVLLLLVTWVISSTAAPIKV